MIELVRMTPAFLEALLDGRRDEAAKLLGIEIPDEFPSQGERGFLAMRLRQMRDDPRFEVWCPHAVVLGGQMIGHAGYHGPPGVNSTQNPDAVEFGYSTFPAYRGRGYASEAATMLMAMARERGVDRFVLSVAPDNEPSLAIVRKFGFVRTGEQMDDVDGLEHVFELTTTSVDSSP
jgi:RimJ/RimL family protein N-acetyltransferase